MKKLIFYLVSVMLLATAFHYYYKEPIMANNSFADIPSTHVAYHEIHFLIDKKVIDVTSPTFKPTKPITRLEVAIMMSRALKLTPPSKPKVKPSDLNTKSKGYKEVLAVMDKGMFTLKEKKFQPNEPLTRGEMARVLTIAYQLKGNKENSFKDVPQNNPLYNSVDALIYNQVVSGYGDGTYKPNLDVSKQTFAIVLAKMYKKPLEYIVKQNGKVLHKVKNRDQAINLALKYPKATVHPVNNSLMTYQQKPAKLESTGIRNGVIIFNGAEQNTNFTADYYKPYLTSYGENKDTLFESYILLGRSYPNGEFGGIEKNHANYQDWQWYINQTFAEKGALTGLNDAAKQLNKKANVYITIPYPKLHGEFLYLDGKRKENTLMERKKIVTWYVNSVEKKWKQMGYSNLEFKGFYWVSETLGYQNDDLLLAKVKKDAKALNKTIIYSPHAFSANYQNWNRYGFDGAYLQPNAFKYSETVSQIRLHRAFLDAQIYGIGINIEINQCGPLQIEGCLDNFRQYIDMTHRYQLEGQSLIFYQGVGMVDRMIKYPQPAYKETYKLLTTLGY